MTNKFALFAFNGEPMCFVHVLLNALDMIDNGFKVKVIIKGTATRQVKELADDSKPFADLYKNAKNSGLIDCVCQACARKTDSLKSAREQNLIICNELSGHPSMSRYINEGYQILIF